MARLGPQALLQSCKHRARAAVISRICWRRFCFQPYSHGYWQGTGPPRLLPETSIPSQVSLSLRVLTSGGWPLLNERETESTQTEAIVFFIIISEVTFVYFYHILFCRNQSINSAHTQGEGIIQGHKQKDIGIIKSCLRAYRPQRT